MISVVDAIANLELWVLSLLVLLGALPMASPSTVPAASPGTAGATTTTTTRSTSSTCPGSRSLVPAWNEAPVLQVQHRHDDGASTTPPDRLRLAVVDDAQHRRDPGAAGRQADDVSRAGARTCDASKGGQGKAHTLNHGLQATARRRLGGGRPDHRRRRRLRADGDTPDGAAPGRPGGRCGHRVHQGGQRAAELAEPLHRLRVRRWPRPPARRAQNVAGAQGCLAGGAQLHTRANLDALGGQIDTTTLAEDTVTTFLTQIHGRRVVFDGNAVCLRRGAGRDRRAVEAAASVVARQHPGRQAVPHVFFRPSTVPPLGTAVVRR